MLWLCSTALRNYLKGKATSCPRGSLVAGVPISLRPEGGDTSMNNQVTGTLGKIDLGTQIADPLARLQAIMKSTRGDEERQMGTFGGIMPTDFTRRSARPGADEWAGLAGYGRSAESPTGCASPT